MERCSKVPLSMLSYDVAVIMKLLPADDVLTTTQSCVDQNESLLEIARVAGGAGWENEGSPVVLTQRQSGQLQPSLPAATRRDDGRPLGVGDSVAFVGSGEPDGDGVGGWLS